MKEMWTPLSVAKSFSRDLGERSWAFTKYRKSPARTPGCVPEGALCLSFPRKTGHLAAGFRFALETEWRDLLCVCSEMRRTRKKSRWNSW